MAWVYFDAATLGNDAKPIDAATMTDVVRNNLDKLKTESPAAWCFPFTNGAPTTTDATYNTTTSILFRMPAFFIRASRLGGYRSITFSAFASVSSGAQTGTLRFWADHRGRAPSATPEVEFSTSETSGITSTTGQWVSITVAIDRRHVWQDSIYGERASSPTTAYGELFVGCQGKVTGGATLTLLVIRAEELL